MSKNNDIDKDRRKPPKPWISWLRHLAGVLIYIPFKIIYPTRVIGRKRFEKRKTILMMNHKSGWDPVLIAHLFRPPVYYVAKWEFTKSRFLTGLLSMAGCIFVHRGEPDYAATKQMMNVLKSNNILMLFPEGTRNPENNDLIMPFKEGAAYYAIREKSPIMPMVIDKRIRPFKRNTIIVGEEFELTEFYDKPITKETIASANDIVYGHMVELNSRLKQQLAQEQAQKSAKRNRKLKNKKTDN